MKKILMTLAAVLCCSMTTTVFTACGSDDDNTNTPPQPKAVAIQIDYSVEFPDTVRVLAPSGDSTEINGNLYLLSKKMEIGYIDENGQEQREVVNNGKWTKSITYKKTLNGYIKLYFTKPASIDVESLPYEYYGTIMTNVLPTISLRGIMKIYSDGSKEQAERGEVSPNIPGMRTLEKDKLPQYFEKTFKSEVEIMTIKLNI